MIEPEEAIRFYAAEEALAGRDPKGQQRENINNTFSELFSALGRALKGS